MYAYDTEEQYVLLNSKAEVAVDFFPNKASAYYFLIKSYRKLDQCNDALDYVEEALLISGKDAFVKSNLLIEKAYCLIAQGDNDTALATAESALKISDNNNPNALELLGDMKANDGDLERAVNYWKLAKEKGGSSTKLQDKIEQRRLID